MGIARQDSHRALSQGHLFVMAAQSVYDTSMPRPSKEMVRGEILPSAWVLQPLTVEGKEVTRVIYLAQVMRPLQLAWICLHSPLGMLFSRLSCSVSSAPWPCGLTLRGFFGHSKGRESLGNERTEWINPL